ncbi:fibronectin type III domain-containing protein [Chryseobacterium wangxinyae]|uniref:fibronectin type III domain-containing protein n=1 Tax=Chryseobacterium sp. CY350 TaxID=2997336 RepID=UPI00226F86D3|nr:fibronectin type III domain-containing protein [Chryseobacterium sp. CY350]MCY0976650.1 fibronectin type III domain-containing protein [Chryseobacterium sp. CY350]WBZ96651.1 fibronectin type III domain-containing protein [Chryseobacterium sp. CY350]
MMNHSYNDKIKFNSYTRLKFKDFGIKMWAVTMLMLFSLQSISVKSQQYPVKLVPVVIPPYSMRLGDYATSTDNKLQLQVLMTDLMEPQHQTGIKFTLEAGLNAVPFARSNDFILGLNPFMLYPGSNVTLTNVDLRALFELQNLGGINALQYAQPLSDGVYQFCFQAYDYYTKNNLSSKTCATVFLTQYDPPMLNLPQNAEKVQAMSPYAGGSGIVFQWMPRQIAPNTKYIFTLKELWDTGQSPISGFLSSPPLWQEETYAPTLYYGLDKTQLIPGKRYTWQVQAKSGNPVLGANPTEDNGVYKNNGFSEIYYFDYVENCTVPTLLMAKNVGRGRVEISWSLGGQPAGLYNVQYRKKNSNTEWMTQQSYQSPATLTGLEDLTEYEYRVGSVCGNTDGNTSGNAYSYSAIQYFTTNANDVDNNYQCGIMPAIDIANKNLYQEFLNPGETFTAGDFPVTVISSEGSNGIYSGNGYIVVPYLANTKIVVNFENISINTDKTLIEGIIETSYDPNESAVHYASNGNGLNDGGNTDNNGNNNNGNTGNNGEGNNNGDNGNNNGDGNNTGNNGNNDGNNNDNGDNNDGNNNGNTGNNDNGNNNDGNDGENNGSSNNNTEVGYAIKYKNKSYKDASSITIPYKRDLKGTFEIVGKDIDNKTKIAWSLPNQKQPSVNNTIPGINLIKDWNLDYPVQKVKIGATANELNGKPKVFLDILLNEKKFKIKDFSISENANRIAKNGETLYYINKKGVTDIKKTDFKFTTDVSIAENEIKQENIIWKLNSDVYSEGKGKIIINDYSVKEKGLNVSVTAGTPDKTTKSANIKWEDRIETNVDLFQKMSRIITFLQEFNSYSAKFGKILPCEINIMKNFDALKGVQKAVFNLGTSNEEDPNSRELFNIFETTIQLKSADIASLKCSKSIGWSSFSLGDLYLKASLGSNIDFKYKLKTKNESQTVKSEPEISGGMSLTFSGGFETNPEFDNYVFLDANLNIAAGLKTVYPYNSNYSKVSSYFFLGNTYLTVEGYLDGWIFGGKQNFGPINYLLFDTSWESSKKLIFDLKNKDIYLE